MTRQGQTCALCMSPCLSDIAPLMAFSTASAMSLTSSAERMELWSNDPPPDQIYFATLRAMSRASASVTGTGNR